MLVYRYPHTGGLRPRERLCVDFSGPTLVGSTLSRGIRSVECRNRPTGEARPVQRSRFRPTTRTARRANCGVDRSTISALGWRSNFLVRPTRTASSVDTHSAVIRELAGVLRWGGLDPTCCPVPTDAGPCSLARRHLLGDTFYFTGDTLSFAGDTRCVGAMASPTRVAATTNRLSQPKLLARRFVVLETRLADYRLPVSVAPACS